MPCVIYVDESGDLGWKFDAPYRNGGSSRYLTITAVCVPPGKTHYLTRIIRELYTKYKWNPANERKWADMSSAARKDFAGHVKHLCETGPDELSIHAIVVYKPNVGAHIRKDENKLYNYMIGLCLLDHMCSFDVVNLHPDKRSIKVESGKSLHDYLQVQLWFEKKKETVLLTIPRESHDHPGIQFADMLAGIVQGRYEDNLMPEFLTIAPKLKLTRLFFP